VETVHDVAPALVSEESMAAGITLARWFGKEAGRVYRVLAETAGDTEKTALLAFVRSKGGRVTVRDVQGWNRKKYPRAEDAQNALRNIKQLKFVAGRPGPDGGRPKDYFVLSPG